MKKYEILIFANNYVKLPYILKVFIYLYIYLSINKCPD